MSTTKTDVLLPNTPDVLPPEDRLSICVHRPLAEVLLKELAGLERRRRWKFWNELIRAGASVLLAEKAEAQARQADNN